MPITVEEKYDSRRAGPDWREYAYIVTGTDSEDVAIAAAPGADYITIPNPVVNTLPNGVPYPPVALAKKVTAEQQVAGPDIERHTWYVGVRYEAAPARESSDDDPELNYSITVAANTVNVKTAYEQTCVVAGDETENYSRLFGNKIGAVKVGTSIDYQGVDCIMPQATLEIERRFSASRWKAKVKEIILKVGTVNNAAFEGFGVEEVLFAGARVNRGERVVTASFQFMISPTDTVNIPGIGNISKRGWRYIWVYSKPVSANETKAAAAFVARVYRLSNFSGIVA